MVINPLKKPNFKLIKAIDAENKALLQAHYSSYVDYSRKSDMYQSNKYVQMYNDFI